MPDFRRGAEAIDKAQEKTGSFEGFTPNIFWSDPAKDKENSVRYIMFLNPIDVIPLITAIGFVPVGTGKKRDSTEFTRFDSVIARTDPSVGEKVDPMVRDWGAKPQEQNVAVAVELEPDLEEQSNGRVKPVGFRVKTNTFNRKVRDEKGEATDETEEVTAPVVGFVQQSPHNFFNLVRAFDADTAPIESSPVRITRVDSTTYKLDGYEDVPVDLGDLFEFIEDAGYLSDEGKQAVEKVLALDPDDASDTEVATAIGEAYLDQRLVQLHDSERYDKLYAGITEPFRQFGGGGSNSKSSKAQSNRAERPRRGSQRRGTPTTDEAAEAHEPEAKEEAPKRGRRGSKSEGEAPQDARARLDRLKARASATTK